MNHEIEQILTELQEYFDRKADADWDYDKQKFVGNDEMKLSLKVDDLKFLLLNEKTL